MPLIAASFACGLIFGAGLLISGMTQPEKVLGFLDIFGAWDATLAFVMAGAVAVTAAGFALARRRGPPLLAAKGALAFAQRHRRAAGRGCRAVRGRLGPGRHLSGAGAGQSCRLEPADRGICRRHDHGMLGYELWRTRGAAGGAIEVSRVPSRADG